MTAPMSPDLAINREAIGRQLGNSMDVVYREFVCDAGGVRAGLLVFVDGIVVGRRIETLLRSLVQLTNPPHEQPSVDSDPLRNFATAVAQVAEVRIVQQFPEVISSILHGETALLLDGVCGALVADTRQFPGRNVEEPVSEAEVRGPRDGLTEDILINTGLIRKRIKDPHLRLELLRLGRRTQTDCVLAYIEGLAEPSLVDEVRTRIARIDVDAIIGSGPVEEMIQDNPWSPFGILLYTERPDKVCAALLEGRVAFLVDNTPFALCMPVTLWQLLQAPGDYYHYFWAGTAFRWVRLLALLLAFVGPSLYVMLGSFHHEMIPTPLALSMAGGREGTPLPVLLETLAMTVMFEVMHEAGLRLPRAVGQTVSIVGALVIGEAAVMAGLVAPATVIVVAGAGISAFAIPSYSLSVIIRLLRVPLLLLAGTLGVFGFVAGTTA
ncbi:MAG TPA: spore germination protein, partial [Symbiobacteriaceae bacterium]|nr:spore germination protein [Symbiobacteriaceae bacterium]